MPPVGTSNSSSSSLGQLSLRHIPDISDTLNDEGSILSCNQSSMQLDTSFSIQISGVCSNTLLADEDAENFFGGTDADMSIEENKSPQGIKIQQALHNEDHAANDYDTPRAGSRRSKTALELQIRSELEVESVSSVPFPPPPFEQPTRLGSPLEDSFAIIPSATSSALPQYRRPNETPSDNGPQASSKLCSPKVKQSQAGGRSFIQKNGPSLEVPAQPSRDMPTLRNKQKITEGGISKSKLPSKKAASTAKEVALAAKSEARSGKVPLNASKVTSLPKAPLKDDNLLLVDTPSFADASSSSIISPGGVAARLMQYGKEYQDDVGSTPSSSLLVDIDAQMDSPGPCSNELRLAEVPAANLPTKLDTSACSESESQKPISAQSESARNNQHINSMEHNDMSVLASGRTLPSSDIVVSLPEQSLISNNEMETDIPEDDRDGPLTLSQLSPRKQAAAILSKRSLSKKRIFPTDEETEENEKSGAETIELGPKMKKSRNDDSTSRETQKPGLASRPRLPSARAVSSTAAGPSRSRARSGTVSAPRKAVNMSGSGSSATSSSKMKSIPEAITTTASGSSAQPAGREIRKNRRVVSGSSINNEKKPASRTLVPLFNPAVGWNDDVHTKKADEEKESRRLKESRLTNNNVSTSTFIGDKARPMTRSHTRSQSQNVRLGNYHPAPNFKAIHEAFNESLASRKATFHPTVPVEMQWETDARMEQRRKFDELVKEKEREKERLEEEMKKKREEEEEKEVKELRKKLVVKANEVPEWYRDVPRKVREEVGGV